MTDAPSTTTTPSTVTIRLRDGTPVLEVASRHGIFLAAAAIALVPRLAAVVSLAALLNGVSVSIERRV